MYVYVCVYMYITRASVGYPIVLTGAWKEEDPRCSVSECVVWVS